MSQQQNVLVISCGGAKHDTTAGAVPALDLYSGRQFALARRLAALGWSVVVMSTRHGLVPAHQPLAAYDCQMDASRSAAAVANIRTGRSVSPHRFAAATHGAARVVFYGGAHYVRVFEALCTATGLARCDSGCEVEQIIGAGCGDHYSVLASIVAEAEAA